jgi:hypothetical protein
MKLLADRQKYAEKYSLLHRVLVNLVEDGLWKEKLNFLKLSPPNDEGTEIVITVIMC